MTWTSVFENVAGDDFSFWALQHYENSTFPTLDAAADATFPSVTAAVGDSPSSFCRF